MSNSSKRNVLIIAPPEIWLLPHLDELERSYNVKILPRDFESTIFKIPESITNRFWSIKRKYSFIWFYNLRLYVKEHKISLVHLNISWLSVYGVIFLSGLRCRCVIHSHSMHPTKSARKLMARKFGKLIFKIFSSHNIACSEGAGSYMFDKSFSIVKNNFKYKNYKYNKNKRSLLRNELSLRNSKVIIQVANFHHQKGQIFCLEILKQLDKDYSLILMGQDGGFKAEIMQFVTQHGLSERVTLIENRFDVQSFLSAADIFLFPSEAEGFGRAVVEAQVSGLPVICSDQIPQCTKISKNFTQLSLTQNTISEWADAVKSVDASSARQRQSLTIKETYDSDVNSSDLAKEYSKAIGE